MERTNASNLVDILSSLPSLKEKNAVSCFMPDFYFSYSNTESAFHIINLNRTKNENSTRYQNLSLNPAVDFEVIRLVVNTGNIICLVGEHQSAFVEITPRIKTELARGGTGLQVRFI
jgi:hypothetical protein